MLPVSRHGPFISTWSVHVSRVRSNRFEWKWYCEKTDVASQVCVVLSWLVKHAAWLVLGLDVMVQSCSRWGMGALSASGLLAGHADTEATAPTILASHLQTVRQLLHSNGPIPGPACSVSHRHTQCYTRLVAGDGLLCGWLAAVPAADRVAGRHPASGAVPPGAGVCTAAQLQYRTTVVLHCCAMRRARHLTDFEMRGLVCTVSIAVACCCITSSGSTRPTSELVL